MKSTEAESPLKSPSKIGKSKVENLRKKNPSKSRKRENISLQERSAELQEVQMKALEEAQKRQQDMKNMLEEECQMDAAEREKTGNFYWS